MGYREFLESKRLLANDVGFTVDRLKLNAMLFEFQKDGVLWALRKGRAAFFLDCGLGKTFIQLEWARLVHEHTNEPILILAPLAVSHQTIQEGIKFGIDIKYVKDQSDVINGLNITNYEKLHHFEAHKFVGIVLDESSILKSYTGKIRSNIIDSFSKTKYRLACTATPSPNDFTELGNHSEFLGVMSRTEMLSCFFYKRYCKRRHLETQRSRTKEILGMGI